MADLVDHWSMESHRRAKAGPYARLDARTKCLGRTIWVSGLLLRLRNGQMSDMTIFGAMRQLQAAVEKEGRVGFLDPRSLRPAVPHGLRSSFRDWVAERTDYPRDMAEMALAHTVGSDVERAYRRTDMVEKRREMMEEWARFCLNTKVIRLE